MCRVYMATSDGTEHSRDEFAAASGAGIVSFDAALLKPALKAGFNRIVTDLENCSNSPGLFLRTSAEHPAKFLLMHMRMENTQQKAA